jgi:hypothetical protein
VVNVSARLVEARRSGDLYEAVLEVEYGGRKYRLSVARLLRRPGRVEARLSGDYVLVEMRDEEGAPLATCCIHRGHLEKGRLECPSLLAPPR